MTNKELLELAANAAGGFVYVENMGWIEQDEHGNRGSWWNPLGDDGDALRLAVKLGLDVRNGLYTDMVFVDCFGIDAVEIEYGDDPYAATRRAIVRAAASIVEQSEAVSSSSLMRTAAEIGKATA